MILRDYNFECNQGVAGYELFKPFADEYSLCDCDIFNKQIYTYYQEGSGKLSYIDHIFMSKELCQRVINHGVVDSGIKLSDHLPISCTVAVPGLVTGD